MKQISTISNAVKFGIPFFAATRACSRGSSCHPRPKQQIIKDPLPCFLTGIAVLGQPFYWHKRDFDVSLVTQFWNALDTWPGKVRGAAAALNSIFHRPERTALFALLQLATHTWTARCQYGEYSRPSRSWKPTSQGCRRHEKRRRDICRRTPEKSAWNAPRRQ